MEYVHIEDLVTLMQRVSQELSTYGTIKVSCMVLIMEEGDILFITLFLNNILVLSYSLTQ